MSDINFTTPDLCDSNPEAEVLPYQFFHFGTVKRFAGPAATISCHEDNSCVGEAVSSPGDGRVLVVDGQQSLRRSLLGDNLAKKAIHNQWAGIIILGAIRDVEIIDTLSVGVFALGVVPVKTDKRGLGQRDIDLNLGGVSVVPGYWLYADRNGVLVASHPIHG
ncbi:MAG: ribonuclease E activity regulator RraA [Luminiphilus sp.]|nr:ribonuclease E activity regulator RraA [Luminiphilus sp.]